MTEMLVVPVTFLKRTILELLSLVLSEALRLEILGEMIKYLRQ